MSSSEPLTLEESARPSSSYASTMGSLNASSSGRSASSSANESGFMNTLSEWGSSAYHFIFPSTSNTAASQTSSTELRSLTQPSPLPTPQPSARGDGGVPPPHQAPSP